MTFTYTGPAAGSKDQVRFLIGDTNAAEVLLSDEEIDWLVSTWLFKGTVYYVAAVAADNLAARFARETTIQSDGQTLDLSALQTKYAALAESLRAQHRDLLVGGADLHVGGVDADQEYDPTVAPPAFGTQMQDNRYAGQQDFGAGPSPEYGVQWGEKVP